MANVPESAVYDAGVYQMETADPVQGGVAGVTNTPLKNLANRTAYLKVHVDQLEAGTTIPPTVAPKNSPVFTGDPQVPTPALGDVDSSIVNTSYLNAAVNGELLKSVAGGVNVVLTAVEAGYGMYEFTGVLTANIAVIVPTSNKKISVKNSTSGAFALTVKTAAGTGIVVAQGKQRQLLCDGTNVIDAHNDLDLSNAALTGVPTAPTPAAGDSTTKIATMEALQAAIAAAAVSFPAGTKMLFQQTNAPTGWTKDATHNDKALRVVSGAAGSGGTTPFSTVMAARTPGGTVGGTTLTAAHMPSHTHDLTLPAGGTVGATVAYYGSSGAGTGTGTTTSAGGNTAHTHPFTGAAMDFAIQYVDLIIATKN